MKKKSAKATFKDLEGVIFLMIDVDNVSYCFGVWGGKFMLVRENLVQIEIDDTMELSREAW